MENLLNEALAACLMRLDLDDRKGPEAGDRILVHTEAGTFHFL